jgi:flagellar FliL protein
MTTDDEKTTVEVNPTAGEAGAKKGGSKLLLFGGIGLGVVIVGVVLALFVIKPMMAGSDGASSHTEQTDSDKHDSHKKKAKHSHEAGSIEYAITDIVVNPAGTAGSRFLSVSFGFQLGSPELEVAFENREQMVRDALITILSSKTVSQLTDAKQKEIMRYQIRKRLSQLLDTEQLEAVYYTDFVLQ